MKKSRWKYLSTDAPITADAVYLWDGVHRITIQRDQQGNNSWLRAKLNDGEFVDLPDSLLTINQVATFLGVNPRTDAERAASAIVQACNQTAKYLPTFS